MGVLGRYGGSALKYYGDILAAAYANINTSDMWATIHNTATQYGLPSPQTQPPDVSTIRGLANKIVNGARTLARASDTDAITADMTAIAPYTSRDRNAIATTPIYQVRYANIVQKADGSTDLWWNTSVFTAADMPGTVGALRDTIQSNADELVAQAAQMSADESGGTSLGAFQLEITLV